MGPHPVDLYTPKESSAAEVGHLKLDPGYPPRWMVVFVECWFLAGKMPVTFWWEYSKIARNMGKTIGFGRLLGNVHAIAFLKSWCHVKKAFQVAYSELACVRLLQ